MYDFAHGQSDSIEQITHSICTLEFIPHRELYNWLIEKLEIFPSHQFEFARLNISYTVMSKRKLLQLVNEGYVNGWDDPRMPTISAFRRKGYTPSSIRSFCEKIGVARRDNLIDLNLLEFCIREELNKTAFRVMAVLDPVKLVITNYPEGQEEELVAENFPGENATTRNLSFSRELWIEKEDFMEKPVKKWFRLAPGASVRLKNAYIIKCESFLKDTAGNVVEIQCTYYPDSKSGNDASGINVKGTIHWVNVADAEMVEVRLYEKLFNVEDPSNAEGDFKQYINVDSLEVKKAFVERSLQYADHNNHYQFIRKGYFYLDKDSHPKNLIFNRTVSLKDTWGKEAGKGSK
jgi:glutaminyl-tRNA synthetase